MDTKILDILKKAYEGRIGGNRILIFYRPEQDMTHMVDQITADQLSVIKTPYLVVQSAERFYRDTGEVQIDSDWEPLTVEEISIAHDKQYVLDILECRKANGFGFILESSAKALPYESASFYRAAEYAVKNKCMTMSPTGAFHHAGYSTACGFCTFNGLVISAMLLKKRGLVKKVGIVDMDVHYPNGTIQIIDRLKLDFIKHMCFENEYTQVLSKDKDFDRWLDTLPQIFEQKFSDVDVIFYQAGADSHISDPAGGILTEDQILIRDWMVFNFAKQHSIPIVWNLAGGYQRDLGTIISIHLGTFHCALMSRCIES